MTGPPKPPPPIRAVDISGFSGPDEIPRLLRPTTIGRVGRTWPRKARLARSRWRSRDSPVAFVPAANWGATTTQCLRTAETSNLEARNSVQVVAQHL